MIKGNYVFVVDDDASARRGITRLLRTAGFYVKDFDSLRSLLDNIESGISGCIILEIRMLESNEKELMAALQTKEVHLPVICITADDTSKARQIAQRVNASGFFRKPVDGTALIDALKWTIKIKKSDGNYMGMNTDSIK